MVPAAGAGTSASTLSVETSTTVSPFGDRVSDRDGPLENRSLGDGFAHLGHRNRQGFTRVLSSGCVCVGDGRIVGGVSLRVFQEILGIALADVGVALAASGDHSVALVLAVVRTGLSLGLRGESDGDLGILLLSGGAGAAPFPEPFVSSCARTWPTLTVSSGWAMILVITPLAGAGTSASILSVETSTIVSPSETSWPSATCHSRIVPSVTDSPIAGI